MAPAAAVEGRLVDGEGRPLAKRSVWLSGKELPPACSVLDSAETDAEGRFQFRDVPLWPFWFEVSGERRKDVRSETISFERADTYRVELTQAQQEGNPPRLTAKVVAAP